MKAADFSRNPLAVCMAAELLAGCGGSQPPIGAPGAVPQANVALSSPSATVPYDERKSYDWMMPVAKEGRLVYVADGNQVLIYPERGTNPPPVGSIAGGVDQAYGLCVDRKGDLYVANDGNNTVTEYASHSSMPATTYSGLLDRPLYPIVDHKGNLFVSNAQGGHVIEYLHGHTSPYKILITKGRREADGMDFDRQGNLYVAYRICHLCAGSIEEFAPGSTRGHSLGMYLNQPQGLIVANDGTIVVAETGIVNRIDVFPPGSKTASLEVGVPQIPNQITITASEHRFFVSTLQQGLVYVGRYPLESSSNFLREKIDVGYGAQGVTLSNGQHF